MSDYALNILEIEIAKIKSSIRAKEKIDCDRLLIQLEEVVYILKNATKKLGKDSLKKLVEYCPKCKKKTEVHPNPYYYWECEHCGCNDYSYTQLPTKRM
jgi:hypothetical protein